MERALSLAHDSAYSPLFIQFPGCLTLMEILEIYWNNYFLLEMLEIYKVCWKFSGLVCTFVVNISYNSCISHGEPG